MSKPFIPLKWHAVLVLLIAALTAEAALPPSPRPTRQRHAPRHFVWPAHSHPYGKAMEEWAASWCQWAYAFTEFNNPRTDSADFGVGQSGKVWFLADVLGVGGGGVVRECVMPQDLGEHTISIRVEAPGSDDEVNLLVRLRVVPENEYVPIVIGD